MNDEIYGGFIATPAYRDMLFVQKTDAPWLCVKIMQMANEASIATFVSFLENVWTTCGSSEIVTWTYPSVPFDCWQGSAVTPDTCALKARNNRGHKDGFAEKNARNGLC